jgi:hypothetical protein
MAPRRGHTGFERDLEELLVEQAGFEIGQCSAQIAVVLLGLLSLDRAERDALVERGLNRLVGCFEIRDPGAEFRLVCRPLFGRSPLAHIQHRQPRCYEREQHESHDRPAHLSPIGRRAATSRSVTFGGGGRGRRCLP